MTPIEQYNNAIQALCVRHKVKRLYAFGSVLTDRFNKDSDIDLMVDFEPLDLSLYADNYYSLKFALEDTFRRQVDLLEEKAIRNPYFRKAIDNQKQLIYGS
jgi:hypothetical protein